MISTPILLLLVSLAQPAMAGELYSYNDNGIMGVEIFNYVGLTYKELGDFESAERVFTTGLKYYETYALAFNLAGLYLGQGQRNKAKLALLKAEEINRSSPSLVIKNNRAIVEYKTDGPYKNYRHELTPEQIESVSIFLVKELKALYHICVDCSYINMFLGTLYAHQHDYLSAIQYFDREISVNTGDKSLFSSISREIKYIHIDKLSIAESAYYLSRASEVIAINKALRVVRKKIASESEDSRVINHIFIAFAIVEKIKAYVQKFHNTETSDDLLLTLENIGKVPYIKMPKSVRVLNRMKDGSSAFKVFETNKDIIELLEYFQELVNLNFPMPKN